MPRIEAVVQETGGKVDLAKVSNNYSLEEMLKRELSLMEFHIFKSKSNQIALNCQRVVFE